MYNQSIEQNMDYIKLDVHVNVVSFRVVLQDTNTVTE
jgi:hypothetical protein